MIKRLIEFYQRHAASSASWMTDIWVESLRRMEPLTKALWDMNESEVQRILDTIGPSGMLNGLEQEEVAGETFVRKKLWDLAIVAGVVPMVHPGQPTKLGHFSFDDTKPIIEEQLGFKLEMPDCFGYRGITPRFLLYHCAAALTIKRLIGVPKNMLEIGAGLGNMGLIAHKCGVETYTVIDLPQVAVLSAYFNSKFNDANKIWLAGEPRGCCKKARFFSCTDFSEVSWNTFDLVFNCDSLPEMEKSVQDGYIKLIKDCLTPNGIFLSINHESDRGGQSRVLDAVNRNGRLRLVSRHSFAMVEGYVEEVYKLKV